MKGVIETLRVAFTLTREVEVTQQTNKEKNLSYKKHSGLGVSMYAVAVGFWGWQTVADNVRVRRRNLEWNEPWRD